MHDNYATKGVEHPVGQSDARSLFHFQKFQLLFNGIYALPVSPSLIFRSLNFHHQVSRLHTNPRTHCAPQNMLLQLHRY